MHLQNESHQMHQFLEQPLVKYSISIGFCCHNTFIKHPFKNSCRNDNSGSLIMVFNVSESKTFAFVNVSVGLDKWTIRHHSWSLIILAKISTVCRNEYLLRIFNQDLQCSCQVALPGVDARMPLAHLKV